MSINNKRFDEILASTGENMSTRLAPLPEAIKNTATEIRFRAGRPIQIFSDRQCCFVASAGHVKKSPDGCQSLGKKDIYDIFRAICGYSVHTHQSELRDGFVTIKGGHRAGICGTAVIENGVITGIRDITSVNIRIAREFFGAADKIMSDIFLSEPCGVLIVGPPCSGKTTILRDLARQLASGACGRYVRVTVVDERSEIAAVWQGEAQNDLGSTCDILDGWKKAAGIMAAVRALSPEMIVCDEIGGEEDVDALCSAVNCGVRIAASVHASSIDELLRRESICRLLETGAFDKLVLLHGLGRIERIVDFKPGVDFFENRWRNIDPLVMYGDRNTAGSKIVAAGKITEDNNIISRGADS